MNIQETEEKVLYLVPDIVSHWWQGLEYNGDDPSPPWSLKGKMDKLSELDLLPHFHYFFSPFLGDSFTSSRLTAPSPETSALSNSSVSVLYSRLFLMCEAITETMAIIEYYMESSQIVRYATSVVAAWQWYLTAFNRNAGTYFIMVASIKLICILKFHTFGVSIRSTKSF